MRRSIILLDTLEKRVDFSVVAARTMCALLRRTPSFQPFPNRPLLVSVLVFLPSLAAIAEPHFPAPGSAMLAFQTRTLRGSVLQR